jgi:hypothetical protein
VREAWVTPPSPPVTPPTPASRHLHTSYPSPLTDLVVDLRAEAGLAADVRAEAGFAKKELRLVSLSKS